MKKLLLLLLVFPFVFAGCSDDDDDFDYAANPIVATWTFTKVEAKEVDAGPEKYVQAVNADIKKDSDNSSYTLEFTKNGKVKAVFSKGEPMEGTYTLVGNKLTYTLGKSEMKADIEFSGKTMTLLSDLTAYYKDEEVITELLGAEDAKDVTVTKVTTLETYTKK